LAALRALLAALRALLGAEDLGLDALQRLFQDRAQVGDDVLAHDAGLHGQLPQVGGELDRHPLQVLQRPEVQRAGPPAPPAGPGPLLPAAPAGPLGPAGPRGPVPVLPGPGPGRKSRARLLADPLCFLPQPARVLAHPPRRVLPRRVLPRPVPPRRVLPRRVLPRRVLPRRVPPRRVLPRPV